MTKGVLKCQVSFPTATAGVTFDPSVVSAEAIVGEIEDLGYDAQLAKSQEAVASKVEEVAEGGGCSDGCCGGESGGTATEQRTVVIDIEGITCKGGASTIEKVRLFGRVVVRREEWVGGSCVCMSG